MPWIQIYTPQVGGSLGMSALVAAIPLFIIGVCLAGLKMKAHKAGPLAVASAIAIAIAVWGMPAKLASTLLSSRARPSDSSRSSTSSSPRSFSITSRSKEASSKSSARPWPG